MRHLSKTRSTSTIGVAETRWRRDQSSVAQNRVMAAKQAVCCNIEVMAVSGTLFTAITPVYATPQATALPSPGFSQRRPTPRRPSLCSSRCDRFRGKIRKKAKEQRRSSCLSRPYAQTTMAPYPREQGTIVVNNRIIAVTVTYARSAPFDAMTFLYQAKLSLR